MTDPTLLSPIAVPLPVGPLHGTAPSSPVPHWAVLLVTVPLLLFVIGTAVMAIDRLLQRFDV